MKNEFKYRSDNCIVEVKKNKSGKERYKLIYCSNSLDDCFDYLIGLIKKDKVKRQKQLEKELQNFFDFGDMPDETKC